MSLDFNVSISTITVFIQGILSFFSPCILPIIPLYMSYLSSNSIKVDEQGNQIIHQRKVFVHTIFFILGISMAYLLLGFSATRFGQLFEQNKNQIMLIGSLVIIIMGIIQLGFFNKFQFKKEYKIPIKLNLINMNAFTAFLFGFTFSFAWTPCVGPALSSVLILVSGSDTVVQGLMYMLIYTLGFIIPFILMGLFTTKLLNLIKKYQNILQGLVCFSAIIMIGIGSVLFSTSLNSLIEQNEPMIQLNDSNTIETSSFDFELVDQYGEVHTLEQYKGKTIFLNVWATWCPPCVAELPDIQKLYENYGYNKDDVIVLGLAFPSDKYYQLKELDTAGVIRYLEVNNYDYPTLMDVDTSLMQKFNISSFPTTIMFDANGEYQGKISGMLSYEMMEQLIKQEKE